MKSYVPAQYIASVCPDLRRKTRRWRVLTSLAGLLVLAAFLLIVLGIFLAHWAGSKVLLGVGGACLLVALFLGLTFYERTKLANDLLDLTTQIEGAERLDVSALKLGEVPDEEKILVVRALIDKGNLPGYRIEGATVFRAGGEEEQQQ